jgi:hypothetical protein
MFSDTALAARIDRAEARMCAEISTFVASSRPDANPIVTPISGGLAIDVSPSSPINKVIGLALDVPLDIAALELIEAQWRARNELVRIELSILADPPGIQAALHARDSRPRYGQRGLTLSAQCM